MIRTSKLILLRQAAIIAGFATLAMVVCAPFAELYAYPKLVIPGNGVETCKNIVAHQTLFAIVILAYLITFICDIIAAWALYILLKPVNSYLSLLTALFRIIFAIIAITSLLNMINVFRILANEDYIRFFKPDQIHFYVALSLDSFRYGFHFGLVFFGIYLGLLGMLVWKSNYIPPVYGVLLFISGIGYFFTSLQPYLFPAINTNFVTFTFYGEFVGSPFFSARCG